MKDDEVLATARASLTKAREFLDQVHMERPVTALVARAHARRRRQVVSGGVAVSAAAALALVLVTGGQPVLGRTPGSAPGSAAQAHTVAYVVKRVETALTNTQMVFRGFTHGPDGPSVAWAYGQRNRWVELTGTQCGHPLPNGDCTHRGGSEPYLSDGTALVHGKLTSAYVTYFDRRYSLSKIWTPPTSACSARAALEMDSPVIPTAHWSSFIHTTLACGAASVTGHVRVDGVETTRITGKPVTDKLSPGYARYSHERWDRVTWTVYVNPSTYLPVRIYAASHMFGGPMAAYTSWLVTDVRWLPPTRANIAKATVTIPRGFHRWRGNPGNQ
jgi:hypothetical protein